MFIYKKGDDNINLIVYLDSPNKKLQPEYIPV